MRYSLSKAMPEVTIIMSVEVGSSREGTRVGELRSEFVRDSVIRVPLASASVHVV